MPDLVKILRKDGPLTSNEFALRIQQAGYASSETTARKQIQRAREQNRVLSTYPVQFGPQILYYLEEHLKDKYALAIRKLLPSKPAFNRVFKGLIANKGYITKNQIANFSACVVNGAAKKKLSLDSAMKQLQQLKIIEQTTNSEQIFQIGRTFGVPQIKLANYIRKLNAEQSLLLEFSDWIRSVYLVGWNTIKTRETYADVLNFNRMNWNVNGPTYIGPFTKSMEILSKNRLKSGFIVAEILGFRAFSENDAESLIERVKNITLVWTSIHIFPIVLAWGYSKSALNKLKSNGIAAITLKEVWGRKVQELLDIYNRILSEDDSIDIESVEQGLKIADVHSELNGLIGNIKGDLFEVMTALAHRSQGYDTILKKAIRDTVTFEEYEIDVVAVRGENECLLLECKGRKEGYSEEKESLERHFCNRCKVAADESGWNVVDKYKTVKAVYITTGKLSKKAQVYANETQKSHGIKCSVLTRDEVLQMFNNCDQRLGKLVERYY